MPERQNTLVSEKGVFIGEWVKRVREVYGWTQAEMGDKWGKDQTWVNKIEKNARPVYSIPDLHRFSEISGIKIHTLLAEEPGSSGDVPEPIRALISRLQPEDIRWLEYQLRRMSEPAA